MYNLHPWHGIQPGDHVPHEVRAVIEIAKGSRSKYELDKPSGLLTLDRILFSAVHYPANYGLIPKTYFTDHDPLDIIVICSQDLLPYSIVTARVIGLMEMRDSGDTDDKIIAVASHDISLTHVNDIADLPEHTLQEFRNFFEDYKKLENKPVEVLGFQPKEAAYSSITESLERYRKEILPTLAP
ncbi:inorganic diphosphatase [Mucilaginibacter robiniae]|uniref:Inorganic pyrophosphatase n=1 Tax=Mucilaginibacter robiniae TaxID=2728022 RepID=A0A7L5DZ27_9SPHI|nr:inorganic diphosphatase [Mucilaginibacter robiniae]QJD96051.1 inorganic diphosphatase [Mucilaginibacter robiniae]